MDAIIRRVRLVEPETRCVEPRLVDILVKNGAVAGVVSGGTAESALRGGGCEIDGRGQLLAFPGLIDAHTHVGIYNDFVADAQSESAAAAAGGVTCMISYVRTGKYYLDRGGSNVDFVEEILRRSDGNYSVDYAYHIAPISSKHIGEIETLVDQFGVVSSKIFMFYSGYGLHGPSSNQRDFLMLDNDDDKYDTAHFEFIMREVARIGKERTDLRGKLSVSLHCELADILNAYTARVQEEGKLTGLAAYSAARPPHSEGLAVWIAGYLAHETDCPNINLLHLTSRKALDAAFLLQKSFPRISFSKEVTIGHLLLDVNAPGKSKCKVNPPIRERDDVEYLWANVLEGNLDWIVSDHACCQLEDKVDRSDPDNIWKAKSGFGGSDFMLSALFTEGGKRGMSVGQMAQMTSRVPARRYGVANKGEIAVGYDADIALFDPNEEFVVSPDLGSPSTMGYSVFDGQTFKGRVTDTFVRGRLVYSTKRPIDSVRCGKYVRRV